MKKVAILLLAGSTAALAAPAAAQDNSAFTGPRVEALVGYDNVRAGSDVDNDLQGNMDDQDADGAVYGAAVGYDFAAGGVVVGVEAELTDSSAGVDINPGGDPNLFGLGNVDAGRDIYVGARVGALVGDRALVYGKAGYTNARFDVQGVRNNDIDSRNLDTDGFRVGAGAEYAVTENAYVKLEYRYSNYSEGEIDFERADIADTDRFDVDTDRHQVMAGVGFRF